MGGRHDHEDDPDSDRTGGEHEFGLADPQAKKPLVVAICPTIFNYEIAAFDKAGVAEALAKRRQEPF